MKQTRALTGRLVVGIRQLPKDGYTLIEMLVVLTIISMIVGLVGPRVLDYLGQSQVKTAKLQIESLSSALDLFYMDAGRYPTSSEGLDALAKRPADVENWNGPYLKGCARAARSLGAHLSLSLAHRSSSALRDRVLWFRRPRGQRGQYFECRALTARPASRSSRSWR